MPSISAPPLRPASFLVAMLRSQLTQYQRETRKLKTNRAKLRTKLNEALAEDKGQWQTWVKEVEETIQKADQHELCTELLVERATSMHPTDKTKEDYDKIATELQAHLKSMEYHVDGIKLANKRYSGHVG